MDVYVDTVYVEDGYFEVGQGAPLGGAPFRASIDLTAFEASLLPVDLIATIEPDSRDAALLN